MESSGIKPRTLIARLERLASEHGTSVAPRHFASGEPTDEALQRTFGSFVAEIRRRSNAFVSLGVAPTDVTAFARKPDAYDRQRIAAASNGFTVSYRWGERGDETTDARQGAHDPTLRAGAIRS
jgi:hypothetical protein